MVSKITPFVDRMLRIIDKSFGLHEGQNLLQKPSRRIWLLQALGVLALGFANASCGLLRNLVPGVPEQKEHESYGCVFIVDGLRGDLAKKYANEGLMPNVKQLFLDKGSWIDQATTVFPSITGAALPSLLTGAFPGRHGLPSLYFYHREGSRYHVLYTLKGSFQFNKLLDCNRTKTIFEHFPEGDDTWAIGLPITRGADNNIPLWWGAGYQLIEFRSNLSLLYRSIKRAIFGGDKARLAVIFNGWFDHVEHQLGPESEELKEHYALVDRQLEKIISIYSRLGIFEKTHFALASDHGQLGFEKNVNIWDFIKEEHRVAIVENDWVKLLGFPVDVKNPEKFEDYMVIVPAGQAHALLYFSRRTRVKRISTHTERKEELGFSDRDIEMETVIVNSWDRRPSFNDLRHYPKNEREEVDIIELVRNESSVDFCVGMNRKDDCVYVFGKENAEARIERRYKKKGCLYRYTVFPAHSDPLGYMNHPSTRSLVNRKPDANRDEMYFSNSTWQQATLPTFYPDAPIQLTQVFDTDRAPDLFISGTPGYNLIGNTYTGEVSRHGALNKWESWATLAFSGPGIKKQIIPTARIVDLVPTLLSCMQVPFEEKFMDGEVLKVVQEKRRKER